MINRSSQNRTVIIGGGHNGLVCAAYLAKAGREVTLLEAKDHVGGAAITREFAPGFRVSAGAHMLNLLDGGISKDLDLESHGLKMAKTSMDTISLDQDGDHVRISGSTVEGVSADDQAAMQEYHRLMTRFAGILGYLHGQIPPRLGTTERRDLMSLARLGWRIRRMGKRDMREFLRLAGINVYDMLQEKFDSELLKGALSLDGVLGTFLGTRSNNSVFCAMHRWSNGCSYGIPAGGMGAVSNAIARGAAEHGAEIRMSSPVKRILMDFDRVCGVELASGEKIMADTVVSSADPTTTFFKLLGAQNLEAGFANRVKNIRSDGYVAKLHLALNSLPGFTGLDSNAAGERLTIAPSLQYVEHAFNHAKYGEYSAEPVLEIRNHHTQPARFRPGAGRQACALRQRPMGAQEPETGLGRREGRFHGNRYRRSGAPCAGHWIKHSAHGGADAGGYRSRIPHHRRALAPCRTGDGPVPDDAPGLRRCAIRRTGTRPVVVWRGQPSGWRRHGPCRTQRS
jgi:phytoene dehydrogenase-like protein